MTGKTPEGRLESCIDWITVTTKYARSGKVLYDLYVAHKEGDSHPAKFFGFECVRDENGLTWGKRMGDGCFILIAPGETAAAIWRKCVSVKAKVTRIDLACDVWLEIPRDQVRQSARVPMSPALDTRISSRLITGISGHGRSRIGDTLYLGHRSSTQYGRMYDKGLQQKSAPPGKWTRYEVEYTGQAALQIAAAAHEMHTSEFGSWIRATVYDWYLERSVVPLFDRETDRPGTRVRMQMKQTSVKRKLVWLQAQVKPTVQYLFEQGLRDEALAALGVELVKIDTDGYSVLSDGIQPVKKSTTHNEE